MDTIRRLTAAAIMVITGFAIASTTTARADDPPWPWVGYHWCPGQPFNEAAWGYNFDPSTCHDARHRDMDGLIRSNDYLGPSPFQDQPNIPNTRP